MQTVKISSRALIACAALLGACGSQPLPSGATPTGSMPPSVSADLSTAAPADLTPAASGSTSAISCGGTSCAVGQVCCFSRVGMTMMAAAVCGAPGSCGDGGVQASCDGPTSCGGGTPSCCLSVSLGKDMSIMGDAMCTSQCAATGDNAGGVTSLTTKLCKSDGDCAGYMGTVKGLQLSFGNCCSRTGIPAHFCAPPAALAQGQYTCP
jgi:hypothetical protein